MFSVTIQKEHLETALKLLSNTVGDNSKGFSDDCIQMIPDQTMTKLKMTTTDTVNFTTCDVILGLCRTTDPAPLVNFNRLKKIVSSIPKGEMITLEETKGNELTVKYKLNSGITLVGTQGSFLPAPSFNNTVMSVDYNFLKKCADDANAIIDYDINNGIFNCLNIEASNLIDLTVTAIDSKGNRAYINKFHTNVTNPDMQIFVEAKQLSKAMQLFDGYSEVLLCTDSNNSFVKVFPDTSTLIPDLASDHQTNYITNVEYYRRLFTGNYPNVENAFNNGALQYTEVNAVELMGTLQRVKAIEDSYVGNRCIELSIQDRVIVKYTSPYGEVSEDTTVSKSLANKIVGNYVNSSVMDILSTSGEYVEISELNNKPGFLLIKNSNNGIFLLSPVQSNSNP